MVNYQNGKIYKIECNETGQVYYGSTTRKLCERVADHRSECRMWLKGKVDKCQSFDIIERGNYSYSLVEDCSCERKEQLHARERFYIKNNECVNKRIPGRTMKEWREENKDVLTEKKKEYYNENKEKINEKKKEYYNENKEKINEKKKEYYNENKEKLAEKKKEYREANKEKIAERKAKKVRCECCNIEMRTDSWLIHTRTKKHITNSN
jgi:hypothetical protein